ncbi:MAG TPA: hypothetical protein VJ249_11215 [Candidatus Bathyarchaeia archaeon]|nr:hypothetical protein [Candidatus Bathyarchaeia archaeon]
MKTSNSLTHRILRIIGSPFATSHLELRGKDVTPLYHYATRNRMPLRFLQALGTISKSDSFAKEYDKLRNRYTQIVQATSRVSQALEKASVDYAFFKSIRPYREVTVDLDILIFSPEYQQVIRNMSHAGYTFLAAGPLSTTFRDAKAEINIDLYNEIGASHIIYLDKQKLRKSIIDKKLSNGKIVRTLDPCADLVALIAHSVLKEQMYVLSEYYTTLYSLANTRSTSSNAIISMVEECKISRAFQTHLGLSALLHQQAHGFIPDCLAKLLSQRDLNPLESTRVEEVNFLMPFKYHPITVVQAFVEKFREAKARKSFTDQISSMLNPKFTSFAIRQLLGHIIRETY